MRLLRSIVIVMILGGTDPLAHSVITDPLTENVIVGQWIHVNQ